MINSVKFYKFCQFLQMQKFIYKATIQKNDLLQFSNYCDLALFNKKKIFEKICENKKFYCIFK